MRLTGVVVRNAGVDWAETGNCYWRHRVARREAARIVLHGQAEFEASHVVLSGDQTFEVGLRHPLGHEPMFGWLCAALVHRRRSACCSYACVEPL